MNPLFLGDPLDHCPVCGTNLRAHVGEGLRPCPFGPHEEGDYPRHSVRCPDCDAPRILTERCACTRGGDAA